MLSNWLLEDINEENLFSNIYKKNNTINNNIQFGANYTQSVYSRGSYYSRVYYGNYNNYHAYGDYSDNYYSDDWYTEYSKSDSYIYSKTGYSVYADYSNACAKTCQVCNTCQTKCQVNQFAYTYVGHQMSFSNDLDYIENEDYNDLIDYINAAATVCLLNINLTNKKVADHNIVNVSIFNDINDAIKQFIDGTTGYSTKNQLTDTVLKVELNHFKDVLNQVKIPTTIPCCQTAGYQNCISRQK